MLRFVSILSLLVLFGTISIVTLGSVSPQDAVDQTVFVAVGIVVFLLLQLIPATTIRQLAVGAYVVCIVLLILTLLIGDTSKGAKRWILLGPVSMQTSEIAKPLVALAAAAFLRKKALATHKDIIGCILFCIPLFVPIFLQPDLGSVLSLAASVTLMFCARLTHWKILLPWGIVAIFALVMSWNFLLYDYQKDRILSFVGRGDSQTNYNATQAIITLGSGKLSGRGLGHGVQSNLQFLPEHHTDFFFSSYAEEFGFIGVAMLLLLFTALLLLLIADLTELEDFDYIVRLGFLGSIVFQLIVHMGMNTGMLPVTGIPLPFLSSGGSSFVSMSIFLSLTLLLSSRRYRVTRSVALDDPHIFALKRS